MGRCAAGRGSAGRQVNKATERRPFLWLVYKSVRWRERGSSSDKVICIVLLIATTTTKANSITPTTNKRERKSGRERGGEKEMR